MAFALRHSVVYVTTGRPCPIVFRSIALLACLALVGCQTNSDTRALINNLAGDLKSANEDDRYDAAKELEEFADELGEHILTVAVGLKDPSPRVAYRCAKVLAKAGKSAEIVVPELVQALASHDVKVRRYVAKALDHAGHHAKKGTAALIKATRDTDVKVRYYATKALGNIEEDQPDIVVALQARLNDADASIQKVARSALKKVQS